MEKIEFKNLPDTSTPLSADIFNDLQDNVEEAIDSISIELDSEVSTVSTNGIENQAITNYINDVASGIQDDISDLQDANIYSTTEKKVGTWIDGKPIYRRIVNFTTWTMGVDLTSWNISTITSMQGTYRHTDGAYNYQRPLGYGNEYVNMFYRESDKTIQFRTSYTTTSNIYRVSAVLEYTKTTD